jgi:hypothetical protein
MYTIGMSNKIDLVEAGPSISRNDVDVRNGVRSVMGRLYRSLNAAARAADINPGQLHHLLASNNPGANTLSKLGLAWGVPPFIFLMPAELAEPYIQAAERRGTQNLENSI